MQTLDDITAAVDALRPWAKSLKRSDCPIAPDDHVSQCWSIYAPSQLEELLIALTPYVSFLLGEQLVPVNSFLRRYEKGAILKEHVDREDIEWTASLILHHEGPPWPLRTRDEIYTGPMSLLQSGITPHWRDEFLGDISIVGLLHWKTPGYNIKSPVKDTPPFLHISQALMPEHLCRLYDNIHKVQLTPGMISYRGLPSTNRANMISWLPRGEDWGWLYERLFSLASGVNDRHWQLDINGPSVDEVQFTRYEAGEFYGWHFDVDDTAKGQITKRTLSLVCLTQEAQKGGGLEIRGHGVLPMALGDAIVFPATIEHRAVPVELGVRDSLVLWLSRH